LSKFQEIVCNAIKKNISSGQLSFPFYFRLQKLKFSRVVHHLALKNNVETKMAFYWTLSKRDEINTSFFYLVFIAL
jgi:hypothetical protein